MALSTTGAGSRGSTRIFSVVELQRVGNSLQPTGTEFKWSNTNFSAPRGPWNYAIKLRTVRRDLPGAEEPSEQVLGWNYEAFTCAGIWDDRHNGNPDEKSIHFGFAEQTRRDFEEMVKRGNSVKIQMEKIAVTGLITNLAITWHRFDRIGYSFTLSPHFRFEGETVRTEVNPSRGIVSDPKTSVAKARAALDSLQASQEKARAANLSKVQQLLSTSIFGDIGDQIDDIGNTISHAEQVVENEITVADDATNALYSGAQIMQTVKTSIHALLEHTRKIVSTSELALDSLMETFQFENWIRGVNGDARTLAVQATQSQLDFKLRANAKPARLHRVRQGETLYTISNIYYGTPHHWRDILSYNHLSSIILEGGELLTIPELR